MHGLHYRAIDQHGRIHTGFSARSSADDVEQWVLQRGWHPLPVSLSQRIFNALKLSPRSASWSKTSAGLFTLNFAQLLQAGVPLLQALEEIAEMEGSQPVKQALLDIHEQVDQGRGLSDALSNYPQLFEEDYIASVKAGERSGNLSECLKLQAENLHFQAELANRLKTVLTYPAFAMISIIVVLLFVLLYLVPAMLPLLSMNKTLPLHTQWLLALSDFLRQSGLIVLLCLSGLIGVGLTLLRSVPTVQQTVHSFFLSGRYGKIMACFSLARYARTTSLLYEAGIEITDAMRVSQKLVRNPLLRRQLNSAHQLVLGGDSLGQAMREQSQLPNLFVQMVIAGERAGVLGVALRQCAEQLQSNAKYSLDRAERLIGPVLLSVMGAVLLWVALSILGPMYSTITDTGTFL